MRIASMPCVVVLSLLCGQVWGAATPPPPSLSTAFTYQGQLRDTGLPANGTYDFTFSVFDGSAPQVQIGSTLTVNSVTVTNGLFTVPLDFGLKVFTGQDRYLEVSVQLHGGASFTTLSPRQQLTAAPYALALPNLRTEASQNGPTFQSANVIGGSTANTVAAGVTGAVIAGGGATNGFPQQISGLYGDIGGGFSNTITAAGYGSSIAGGTANTTSNTYAAIAGGTGNAASGQVATIGGGQSNTASATGATVPGGLSNTASGATSFAAGNRAKAVNNGSFVWGDSTNADVTSTVNDQFTVRANGGVVVNTNADVALNATNGVTLSVNANNVAVPGGTLYRDNTIVAWGHITGSSGAVVDAFNATCTRNSAGNYTITLTSGLAGGHFMAVATPTFVVGSQPTTAATARLATVNQLFSSSQFNVFMNNGLFAATDNDFNFIVLGR